MKPCRKNRKWVAWHVLGALTPDQDARLENHFASCQGCVQYRDELYRVTHKLGSLKSVGLTFDETIQSEAGTTRNLRLNYGGGRSRRASPLRNLMPGWRLAGSVLAAIVLCGLLIPAKFRNHRKTEVLSSPTVGVPARSLPEDMAPTVANYRALATQSLDELDELLAKQAQKPIPAVPPLSLASLASFAER